MRITDLPEPYQKQAAEKLEAQKRGKNKTNVLKLGSGQELPSKYGNEKTEVAGIKFDSKKEAKRFEELALMEAAGEITDLHLQQSFTLQESWRLPTGEKVDRIKYVADFTYYDNAGNFIIEDVKGHRTEKYLLKKKLMAGKGYFIREV